VTSTHRGHGHSIGGADLNAMMAEIFGKQAGVCKGKGGPCTSPTSAGHAGANGIVGAAFRWRSARPSWVPAHGESWFLGDGATTRVKA
jgi:TPP-dependent pyruvate/acetoin dehydrogenase alpha subunit